MNHFYVIAWEDKPEMSMAYLSADLRDAAARRRWIENIITGASAIYWLEINASVDNPDPRLGVYSPEILEFLDINEMEDPIGAAVEVYPSADNKNKEIHRAIVMDILVSKIGGDSEKLNDDLTVKVEYNGVTDFIKPIDLVWVKE